MKAFIPKLCCLNCSDYCSKSNTEKAEKIKGIYIKPFKRYCLAGKKGREMKSSEGVNKIPVWCPKKHSPVMSVYDFKDADSRLEYEMIIKGQSFEYPNTMLYRLVSSADSAVTAEEFTDYIDENDIYSEGTVIAISDGVRSVAFYKHSRDGWTPVLFQTDKVPKEENL